MSRLLGIDSSAEAVRIAVIRTSYRRVSIEALAEVDVAMLGGSELDAIRAVAGAIKPEAVAIVLSGERTFFRRLDLPAAAQKELQSVLGFELEATAPFEMDEAVFDYRILKRPKGAFEALPVFAALARIADVKERIDLVRSAIGVEPERVGAGASPLANLVALYPELERASATAPLAIANLAEATTDVLVMQAGEPVFVRTVSRGTAGLNATSANEMARELRQTFAAFRAQGGAAIGGMVLLGPGAQAPHADSFLAEQLGVPVVPLQVPKLEQTAPDLLLRLPRFARAIGLALGMQRNKSFNLRQGALEPERQYPFLREKIPLLAGLAAVIAVSFGFSIVAEMRTLAAEKELLTAKLAVASRDVLGEDVSDPEKAKELLEGPAKEEDDPMPHADAFDAIMQISKAVPKDVVHDVVEFEFSRQHVNLQGTVPSVGDAETISKNLKEYKCAREVKVGRTSAFGDGKQKYVLDFDVKCTDPKKKTDAAGAAASASAASAAAGAPKPDATAKDGGK